ncbi:MAG: GlsB/YeaQ/YmgE family stress response membrane protein [Thermoanaerobaculia bacterium]
MQIIEFLILLVVAGVCGALGQAISGFSRGSIFVTVAIGFIGALLGTWISRALSLPDVFLLSIGSTRFPIVWSIVGSVIFVVLLNLLSRRKKG